eukprot:3763470-Prorocentrum_lima.AAC.1
MHRRKSSERLISYQVWDHCAVEVGPTFLPYAAMYVADVMRHNSIGRLWSQPALGELVAVTKPGPKKALEAR